MVHYFVGNVSHNIFDTTLSKFCTRMSVGDAASVWLFTVVWRCGLFMAGMPRNYFAAWFAERSPRYCNFAIIMRWRTACTLPCLHKQRNTDVWMEKHRLKIHITMKTEIMPHPQRMLREAKTECQVPVRKPFLSTLLFTPNLVNWHVVSNLVQR